MPRSILIVGGVLVGGIGMAAAAAEEVIREDFDTADGRLPAGWRAVSGAWRVDRGALWIDSLRDEAQITFGDESWQNYQIEVTATFLKVRNDSRWLAILFRAAADGSTPWSQFPVRFASTAKNGTEFAVRTDPRQWSVRRTAAAEADSELGRPRTLRVVVRGCSVRGFLDDQPLIESPFCVDRRRGCVGLSVSGCVAKFDDFVIHLLPETPRPTVRRRAPCEIVAHRGFSAVAPENTLAAIRQAIRCGAHGCEFDVRGCRDGTLVLMHDETVDRTTNGKGKVSELTLAELKRLDAGSWMHPRNAGERVPTLAEALAWLKGSGCRPVIEIKAEGISRKVVDAVKAADMLDSTVVISFSQDAIREIRVLEPRLPCGWLCGKDLKGPAPQRAAWIAAEAKKCDTTLVDLDYRMLSPEVIAELDRRGLTVWTWTVDQRPLMTALMSWGVEGITTNRPDLLRK